MDNATVRQRLQQLHGNVAGTTGATGADNNVLLQSVISLHEEAQVSDVTLTPANGILPIT